MAACDRAGITGFEETRPWMQAALWLAALTPLFFLSYGLANWVTSQRPFVPSLVFGWERRIPFVAWTIVPYWSTDVLYAASLFLCRTRGELNTHAKRLAAAQIISVSAFLLFPLRFTFDRPYPAGAFGWMFDSLARFDQPYNQAPSLHLSLTTILWAKYSQHMRGGMLGFLRAWMIVTGVSTLTTYQHHFIDIPTGIWVGLFCLVLFPDNPAPRGETVRNFQTIQVGAAYLAGSLTLVSLAARMGGAAWWLLWPAGSLLIVAGIYFSGRPELFRKSNGLMPRAMTALLAPYLAAAWLNSRLWTRKAARANEITDGIRLGRLHSGADYDREGIRSVVDLSAELPVSSSKVVYRAVPMLDLVPPGVQQLERAVEEIEGLRSQRPTLVCCALGYSRSAAAVAAWMVASGKTASVQEAVARIKARRPRVVLGRAHKMRLEEWRDARGSK